MLFLISVAASAVSVDRVVNPIRIKFDDLHRDQTGDDSLMKSLASDGFVALREIPGFKASKLRLMSNLHSCIIDLEDDNVNTLQFDDGTYRRSFATTTGKPITILEDIPTDSKSESCQLFEGELSFFRSTVEVATQLFVRKLSDNMSGYLQTPLMSSNVEGVVYNNIKEMVAGGVHLEHFHSYHKDKSSERSEATTIEFHTDQGFFIAFTPGLIVSSDSTKQLKISDGFFVQDRLGEKATAKFSEDDDLVFMIGDGANQYINSNLVDTKDAMPLRATPHALSLPALTDSSAVRTWYGLMVLPPNNALSHNTGMTHGEIRNALMDATTAGKSLSLGCSSQEMTAVIYTSRHLSGTSEILNCTADELFCWYRCQPLDDELKTCADRDLTLECVDSQGEKTDPAQHNGASPACYNSMAQMHMGGDHTDIHSHEEGHHGDDGHNHGDDHDHDRDHNDGDDGDHKDEVLKSSGFKSAGNLFALIWIATGTILKLCV